MEKGSKIYIAGHRGMVGSAICRKLQKEGFTNFVWRTSSELDLRDQAQVADFFNKEKPDYVFLAAAKVGGIVANNTFRGEFLYDNLMIQSNVIHQSYLHKVKKILFLGSSCMYPKMAAQPLTESALLTGVLEPTNEPYAIAKIAGIKLCETYRMQYGCNFISCIPTNLYGPNDHYDLNNSHVLPALIRKFHEAKLSGKPFVELWGTGSPLREFLHVDDFAEACLLLMENYEEAAFVNVGSGKEISIYELALLIKNSVGYKGDLQFDTTKPDGTPRKLMDSGKINRLGWTPRITLEDGVQNTYEAFLKRS